MGKFAARVGDPCSPPHLPPILSPGPGAMSVIIGGKPAWRANIDMHMCSCPIAPPAPATHALETCFFGSLSVMIESQMAVRMGDLLVGAGPPNTVMMGAPTVIIGDVGFGLAATANMAEFCADFAQLMTDWSGLTPEQRRQRLEDIINRQLAKSGIPPQSVVGSASHAPGNAQYDFTSDTLEISAAQLNAPSLTPNGARELANAVYHEARHAEQWSLMARQSAASGNSAAQIANNMGITGASARAAAANPLVGVSPQSNLAQASMESVYGSRYDYRDQVLSDINNKYDEYRALPEEQDAWNTGDGLPCG